MKKFKIALSLYGFLILGFTYSALAYLDMLDPLYMGLSMLPWWSYLLLGLIAFYFTLAIHELTHLITFKYCGVSIRALYLTIFVFYKTDKGWRFRINPKLWVLFGGLVIPDLEKIDSHSKYQKTKDAFAKSLLAAPITTISFMILAFFTILTFLTFSTHHISIAIIFVFNMIAILLSVIYIRTFSIHTDTVYGDIIAHQKMKEDSWFELAQISQYQMFSLNDLGFNKFLFDRSKYLLETLDKPRLNIFKTMILMNYFEGVNYYGQEPSLKLASLIDKLNARSFKRDENGLMAAYELATYQYHVGQVDKSYRIYETIQKMNYKNIDERLLTYLKKRFEDVTHIEYHDTYLSDLKNVYTDYLWIFDKIVDPYEDIKVKHRRQPFMTYETVVQMREDDLDREMI